MTGGGILLNAHQNDALRLLSEVLQKLLLIERFHGLAIAVHKCAAQDSSLPARSMRLLVLLGLSLPERITWSQMDEVHVADSHRIQLFYQTRRIGKSVV